jgi:hypothetical protein
MRQINQPNTSIKESAGWCLRFADRTLGVPAAYLTAWSAWEATKYKHLDRNFPNVAVPVWFDWWGDVGSGYKRYGHVAVRMPDGTIHSSPLTGFGRSTFISVDDLCRQFGNGMKYVGWSEDISNVRIVEVEEMVKVDLSVARILVAGIAGRNGINGRVNALAGQCDEELKKNHVGQDLTIEYIQSIYNSPEAIQWRTDVNDPSSLPTINHKAVFWDSLMQTVDTQQKTIDSIKAMDPVKLKAAYDALGKLVNK